MVNTYRYVIILHVKKITSESINYKKRAGMDINRRNYPNPGILIFGLVLSVTLASCQSAPETVSENIIEDTQDISLEDNSESATTTDDDNATEADPELVVEEINQCLVCHADQETLKDTAYPVVVIESESSGEG